MINFRLPIFIALIILISCKTEKLTHELKIEEYDLPPGTIKIAENFYLDKTEITNISYLEYMFWTSRVLGSEEYRAILPDTNSWILLPNYKPGLAKAEYYLRHPAYRHYPVVGVSYANAVKFCKWRSDRVMEFILIDKGIISHKPNPKQDSALTIERYFSGNYYNIKPSPYIKYYPVYSLPDSATYMRALVFSDSINKINLKYCKNKECKELFEENSTKNKKIITIRCLENIPNRNDTMPFAFTPTKIAHCDYCKRALITDLLGNVRELTNSKNVTFGGSYYDSCSTVKSKYFYYEQTETNAYTGFRNICTWKKWETK